MTKRRLLFAAPLALALASCHAAEGPADGSGSGMPGDASDTQPFSAIAPDETVRFTGTEPFWGGQVAGGSLTYTTPENPDGATFAVERFAGRGGVSWSGTLDRAPFRLVVTPGQCSDGMSDRTYPLTVTLAVAGEQRRGCAWTARQPFTGDLVAAAPSDPAKLAAESLILTQWRKANNRDTCAPLGFAQALDGSARAAQFAGGWAVAWDLPGQRSAFGIAGTGSLPSDSDAPDAQRARLTAQWPQVRALPALPQPAFAGYGIEGAGAYPSDNPQGHGLNSLAYVRVGGQKCDYNVWSHLGRAHLEGLLGSLRPIMK
jgi:uncharacterized membrane protein